MSGDTIGSRLKILIEYLGVTPLEFARSIGFERSEKINRVIRGENKPSFDMLRDISKAYKKTDFNWLIGNVGAPLKGEGVPGGVIHIKQDAATALVPAVPSYAQKNYLTEFERLPFIASLPIIEEEDYNDSVYRDFEVKGDNNAPDLLEGDYLRCKYVDLPEILEKARPDYFRSNLWTVVSKKGIFIGRLDPLSEEAFLVTPLNPLSKSQAVTLEDILELWQYYELRTRRKIA